MKATPEFAARLMAVQACYEMLSTQRALKVLVDDYIGRGLEVDEDLEIKAKPKSSLFKFILSNLDENLGQANDQFKAHTKDTTKEVEPLLKAIALCGLSEMLAQKEDNAIIINDYLNVTHSFYEQGQVSFINGVLDNAARTSCAK